MCNKENNVTESSFPYCACFELREEHMKLAEHLNFESTVDTIFDDWYAPAINEKRPFGNSSVLSSAFSILGLNVDDEDKLSEEQKFEIWNLIIGIPVVMEIILKNRTFAPGVYLTDKYGAYYDYKRKRNHLLLRIPLSECAKLASTEMEKLYAEKIRGFCLNSLTEDPYESVLDDLEWIGQKQSYFCKAKKIFEKYHEEYLKKCDWTTKLFGEDEE